MEENDYIYFFVHAPKTAGSTLGKHIEKNFTEDKKAIALYPKRLGLNPFATKSQNYLAATENYFNNFSRKEISQVKAIYGHTVPYGIHSIFGRPFRYFTFVRNPVKRTISFYNYYRTIYESVDKKHRNNEFLQNTLLVDGRVPNIEAWLKHKYGNKNSHIALKSLYEYYEELGFISRNADVDSGTKELFEKLYFIGITENYREDSLILYKLLKFNRYFIDQNISKKTFITKIDKSMYKEIEEKNKIDILLYKAVLKENIKFKYQNKELMNELPRLELYRRMTTPYTQIRYDFKESLRMMSSFLRKKSGIYSKSIDIVKAKLNKEHLI